MGIRINKIIKVIFFLVFVLSLTTYSVERVGKVVVYGGILEYKIEKEKVFVRDNAHIFYDNIEVFADNIQVDIKRDKVIAVGNVIFWQGSDKTTGDYLEYDNKTGEGYVENALLVRDSQLMYADSIHLSVRKITGKNILITTCELDHPHYFMEAEKIEIFPDEIMYAYNMRYVIHGDTIIKQKVYKIDIKPLNETFKYKYGYSKSRGLWFDIDLNYLMSRASSGWLTYKHVTKGSKTFSTRNSFTTGTGGKDKLNINTSYTSGYEGTSDSNNISLNYSGRMTNGNYSISTNYFANKYANNPKNEELKYNFNLSYRLQHNFFKIDNMNIYWNERVDVDKSKYPNDDKIRVLDKIPEIKLTSDRFNLFNGIFKVNYNYLWGKYFEGGQNELYADKKDSRINISTSSYNIPVLGRFNMSSTITNKSDSKGNNQNTYNVNMNLSTKISKDLSLSQKWTRYDVFGKSAFNHIDQDTRLTYSNTLSYTSRFWRATLISYNYDLASEKFTGSIYSDIKYKKNKFEYYSKFTFNMNNNSLSQLYKSPDYDVTQVYNRLVYDFNKDSYIRFTFPYDRTKSKFSSVYTELDMPLPDFKIGKYFIQASRANLKMNWRKDLIKKTTTSLNIELVFDLHCWEALIKWDKNREEGWLEFYIKSFKSKKHRIFYDAEEGKIKPIIKKVDTD